MRDKPLPKGDIMKKIIITICCLLAFAQGFTCYALNSDDPAVNLITNQGETGIVKEYGSIDTAFANAKNGDTIELIEDNSTALTVNVNKNLTVTTGEKRNSQIIIGGTVAKSNAAPKSLDNINLQNNGNGYLIKFSNISVNGIFITETGDINSDNTVNILDLISLKKSFVDLTGYKATADVNIDKQNDANDMTVLVNLLINKYQ